MEIKEIEYDWYKVKHGPYIGFVKKKPITYHTDFEKNEIRKVSRWFAYTIDHTFLKDSYETETRVGRETGYETKEEAIEALRIEFAMMTRDRCC